MGPSRRPAGRGPLMLGMQMAGIDPYPLRETLIESAKKLVK